MKTTLLRLCSLLICALVLFSGCGTEKAPIQEQPKTEARDQQTNEEIKPLEHQTEETETVPLPVKEELAGIIEKEKDGLRKELEEVLDYRGKGMNPPEKYEEYRALMAEMEEIMIKMVGDTEKDRELIERENELEKRVEEIDPNGACEKYETEVNAGLWELAMKAYYYGENSPYKEGFVTDSDDFYPDAAEGVIDMMCPQGMYAYARTETAVTVRYVDEGTSLLDLSDMYPPEHFEKFPEERTEEQRFIVFEVTECFYGDYEKGNLLFFVPRMLAEELTEELKNGDEWFMFLGNDGDFYNVEYQGEEHGVHSTSTHCIFRVEEGKVTSVSRYNDFRQYNGETPRNLALAMLRIRAKYCYMENEPA